MNDNNESEGAVEKKNVNTFQFLYNRITTSYNK